MQQGVDQGAVGVAGRGVSGHAGRLVDDDQVVVLIEHDQRDVLGLRRCGSGRRQVDLIAAGDGLRGGIAHGDAVALDPSAVHQLLQACTRDRRSDGGEGLVQPLACQIRRDVDRHDLDGGVGLLLVRLGDHGLRLTGSGPVGQIRRPLPSTA